MDNFSTIKKKLATDTKKFLNIQVILSRLENQGYLEKLFSVLQDIKQSEDSFTINELRKIQESNISKDPKFDIEEQFLNNQSIFESNLLLIFNQLVSQIWSPKESLNNLRALPNKEINKYNQQKYETTDCSESRDFKNTQVLQQQPFNSLDEVTSRPTPSFRKGNPENISHNLSSSINLGKTETNESKVLKYCSSNHDLKYKQENISPNLANNNKENKNMQNINKNPNTFRNESPSIRMGVNNKSNSGSSRHTDNPLRNSMKELSRQQQDFSNRFHNCSDEDQFSQSSGQYIKYH